MQHQYSHEHRKLVAPKFDADLLIGLNESLTESEVQLFDIIKKESLVDLNKKRPMITDIVGETTLWTLVSIH